MSRIKRIELFHARMPLIYPWHTAYGKDESIETVLVHMVTDRGEGWGETTPLGQPHYSPEYTAGVFRLMRDLLAPRLAGKRYASAKALLTDMAWVKGNPFAKAGLELAWWDQHAQARRQPLWKLIGGKRGPIEIGDALGVMDSLDMLLAGIAAKLKAGYRRIKLKFSRDWGLQVLAAVRKAYPDTQFHIDCNSSFTLRDTDMFRKVDAFNLAMIEQPLAHDDLVDHAALQRRIKTPICLDESITSPDKARQAAQLGSCRWVNIKPGRVGGMANAVEINRICADAGIGCWVGGMLESGLGAAFCLALATLPNMRYSSDIPTSDRFYRRNLARPALTLSSPAHMTAPDAPGVGATPDPQLLRKLTIERAVLR